METILNRREKSRHVVKTWVVVFSSTDFQLKLKLFDGIQSPTRTIILVMFAEPLQPSSKRSPLLVVGQLVED